MIAPPVTYTAVQGIPEGYRTERHAHGHGQLVYIMSGMLDLNTEGQVWSLSPQRGVWIPSGIARSFLTRSQAALCLINIPSHGCQPALPEATRSFNVSSLLRELILRMVRSSSGCSDYKKRDLILALMLEEITWATESPLPLPQDGRLRRVCIAIMDDPSDRRGLKEWADYAGTSSRTLARLFQAELGMSYQYWRQVALVTSALPRLRGGEAVTKVALDLGYETPGAFSAMFRRVMRIRPSEYREDNIKRSSARRMGARHAVPYGAAVATELSEPGDQGHARVTAHVLLRTQDQ